MASREEIDLCQFISILKEAIQEVLDEAYGERDWNAVIEACEYALSRFED